MRDQWYGDNRDIVKWSTLIHLAKKHGVKTILQIACYRPDDIVIHNIDGDDQPIPLPAEVLQHFHTSVRSIHRINELAALTGLSIRVYSKPFAGDRQHYFDGVVQEINNRTSGCQIVFLDPDTGIEPEGKAKWTHVKGSELQHVYNALTPGDIIVFYQHERQRVTDWREITKKQFAAALNIDTERVRTYRCDSMAHDVVFFVVSKS